MTWFGGDPAIPVMVNGRETFPLVPVAVGLYSTFFNIFNTAVLFPFTGVFERVLSRIGRDSSEDAEDYSVPKYLNAELFNNLPQAIPALQQEINRYLEASALYLANARGSADAPKNLAEHHQAIDILSRDTRAFAARLFVPGMPYPQADLVASLIEEADYAASIGDTLHQIARRVEREEFTPEPRALVDAVLAHAIESLNLVLPNTMPGSERTESRDQGLLDIRARCLRLGSAVKPSERGAILALLGSAERVSLLVARLDAERRSVPRVVGAAAGASKGEPVMAGAAQPAE